jgi:uncharacterized protein GlcG (DUF336 family)
MHTSRKARTSQLARPRRRGTPGAGFIWYLAIAAVLATATLLPMAGCGGGNSVANAPPPSNSVPFLSSTDVQAIVTAAANAADSPAMVIAVVDRQGNVLGVFRKPGAGATARGNFGQMVNVNDLAVNLARTGAFFSNDQAPLSSRTVRFISGIHFPPGVMNTESAALYGIENTNRGCTLSAEVQANGFAPSAPVSGTQALGIITGKADLNDSDPTAVSPGGVPIFKNGIVVGGIGVAGADSSIAEFAAFTGSSVPPFGLTLPLPAPGAVLLNGVTLPFVNQTTAPAGSVAGTTAGGGWLIGPLSSPGPPKEGDLVTISPGSLGGLSAADVKQILDNAEATAQRTRAAIRLPLGSRARMVIAVTDLDGTIIGLRRMPDATVFSIDVAATKARNMVYFNSASRTAADLNQVPVGTAVTNRTIGFGAQPFFPSGIDGSAPGPFFNLYAQDTANSCTQGFQPGPPNAKKSGIVFFPGSVGLYRNGNLIGGLGVSGDGVDQDDYVTAGGAVGFEAPASIRADQLVINGVRLPYLKFPRNPEN